MNKLCLIIVTCLISTGLAKAQQHYLELDPACAGTKSPFTKVQVIDNLSEKQLIGYVQKGVLNRVEKIYYAGTLPVTLGKFFTWGSKSGTKEKNLVVVLNELFLSENTHEFSETGRFRLSLRLFNQNDNGKFREILDVDSVFTVKGLDVTKRLLRSVNEQFCAIAQQAASVKPNELDNKEEHLLEDLYKLDSLDKLQIPLYTSNALARGIYKDYNHLKMNTPNDDSEIIIDAKKPDKVKIYKVYKANNRKIQLKSEGIYAVCDGKRLYKATSRNFYEIQKLGSDFYYDRPAILSESNTGGIVGAAAFGLMGGIVGSALSETQSKTYRFKINHRRGNAIPVAMVY